jgi:hypothetical protein
VCTCVRVYMLPATKMSNYEGTHKHALTHRHTHTHTHAHTNTHPHTHTHTHPPTHTPVEEESDHGPEERVDDEIQKVPAKKGERSGDYMSGERASKLHVAS